MDGLEVREQYNKGGAVLNANNCLLSKSEAADE